ncbi:hypothetical protein EYV94_00970 [Puteibacter caeruleilacunae]|nr:hypothetical protein EYV94_00970 [Puteibacter caeruleilacunae]
MRNIILILIIASFTCCTSKRYLLTDRTAAKKHLAKFINELEGQGEITKRPLVIIDGLPYGFEDLKETKIPLCKDDIYKIDYLSKDSKGAKSIYGERGKNGVLLILTKMSQERLKEKPMGNGKILFLVGDRRITQEELENIDPNGIDSIQVIKDLDTISKYTTEDYEGVVIIIMKESVTKSKASQLPTNHNKEVKK